ncbi:hypothetical protein BJF83_20520 [Nocardiopsis sp. CNR-923]|nr:hypothetical protein BJF83_20520 [Nocardiopsis sp. CNR-923]
MRSVGGTTEELLHELRTSVAGNGYLDLHQLMKLEERLGDALPEESAFRRTGPAEYDPGRRDGEDVSRPLPGGAPRPTPQRRQRCPFPPERRCRRSDPYALPPAVCHIGELHLVAYAP